MLADQVENYGEQMSRLAAIYLRLDLEIPIHNQEPSRTYLQGLVERLSFEIYRQEVKVEVHSDKEASKFG